MAGKGGKGLLAGKTTASNKDKDKKKPVSRSSRAGLQENVAILFFSFEELNPSRPRFKNLLGRFIVTLFTFYTKKV